MRATGLLVILLFSWGLPAVAGNLATLDGPDFYELMTHGFELPREVELRVEAVGRLDRDNTSWLARVVHGGGEEPLSAYAWLLDAETREPVWIMEADAASRVSSTLRRVEETLRLGPGRYELYYFSSHAWQERADDEEIQGNHGWWDRMWSGEPPRADELRRDVRDDLDECRVTLSADGLSHEDLRHFEVTGNLPGAIVRGNRVGNSQFRTTGLEVDRTTSLRIYSIVEETRYGHAAADYGWIVNASTREVVWHPRQGRSSEAGGSEKNRLFDEEVELEAGRYLVYYGTDDSHSFEEFNAAPPHDPLNWGITLLPGEGADASGVRAFEPADPGPPLIDLTRVTDGELREQAFRLTRDGALYVHAVGEYGSNRFADRAWIVNAESGALVWEMTRNDTIGAGGAAKNRMFDGMVALSPGDYVVYYTTDGSHAYDSWNSAMPFEPATWGVSIRPGPGLDVGSFTLLEPDDLAQAGDVLRGR